MSSSPPYLPWQARRKVESLIDLMAAQRAHVRERLAQLRKVHDLTQEEAATKVGVNLRQWQRWEAGDSKPYTRNITAIADAFGITTDDILGRVDSQFDRIERKLDVLLDHYALTREKDHAEMEADLDALAQQAAAPGRGSEASPPGQRPARRHRRS